MNPNRKGGNISMLLSAVSSLTGLSFDDLMHEITGTEEERAKSRMDNLGKMIKHTNPDAVPEKGSLGNP